MEMTQLIVGQFQLTFHFMDQKHEARIMAEHGVIFADKEGKSSTYEIIDHGCAAFAPLVLHTLLRDIVVELTRSPDGLQLALKFESGHSLVVMSDLGHEAGHIVVRGDSANTGFYF
jgi:hypothetical protein